MNYHRYNTETKQYWGSTDKEGDDPTCNYVDIDLFPIPYYDMFTQTAYWIGDGWEIGPLPLPNEE